MPAFEFSRWAIVAPKDDTGLGRMAQDMKCVLPLGRHFVAPSSHFSNHAADPMFDVPLVSDCPDAELEAAFAGFQGVIILERPWHSRLLSTLRRIGVKSVCVPMWEWFRGVSPMWRNCDFLACPNEFCLKVVRSYGFENAALVPWTLNLARFAPRSVRGPARHFIHNAGIVDPDDRKGTKDAVNAFSRVRKSDLRLTVRMQKPANILTRDRRISIEIGNLPKPAALYASGDAFIQPSKLEGMGFMVLEAVASGLPVITMDAPPMNEWGRQPQLFARPGAWRYPAYSSAWIEHSHLCMPHQSRLRKTIEWAAENDLSGISAANREWAEEAFALERLISAWEATLSAVLRAPAAAEVQASPEPPLPCHSVSSRVRRTIHSVTGMRLPLFRRPLAKACYNSRSAE